MQLSKKNRGWREPELCLWSLIPTAIIMPAGLMIYGIAAARGLHRIIPVFGAGLIGFGISVSGTVATSYILDCYKNIDTQPITAVILVRNVVGFAITWATQPWIDNMGRQNAFIVVGILSLVITGFSVVFIGFGKAMRRFTASKYDSLSLRNKTLRRRRGPHRADSPEHLGSILIVLRNIAVYNCRAKAFLLHLDIV